jgi:hypothetical protein
VRTSQESQHRQPPLFLAIEVDDDGTVHLFFDAPPGGPATRGFAGILYAGLDGLGADEIPEDARRVLQPARVAGPGDPAAAARHRGDAGPDQASGTRATGLTYPAGDQYRRHDALSSHDSCEIVHDQGWRAVREAAGRVQTAGIELFEHLTDYAHVAADRVTERTGADC